MGPNQKKQKQKPAADHSARQHPYPAKAARIVRHFVQHTPAITYLLRSSNSCLCGLLFSIHPSIYSIQLPFCHGEEQEKEGGRGPYCMLYRNTQTSHVRGRLWHSLPIDLMTSVLEGFCNYKPEQHDGTWMRHYIAWLHAEEMEGEGSLGAPRTLHPSFPHSIHPSIHSSLQLP